MDLGFQRLYLFLIRINWHKAVSCLHCFAPIIIVFCGDVGGEQITTSSPVTFFDHDVVVARLRFSKVHDEKNCCDGSTTRELCVGLVRVVVVVWELSLFDTLEERRKH